MANIISISTAVPDHCHRQMDILQFMQKAYRMEEPDRRKLSFLYAKSGIDTRYSVLPDYSLDSGKWSFISACKQIQPDLEKRMRLYKHHALPLSLKAINKCINGIIDPSQITHLITVSCTGMSAPGLDLEIAEALEMQSGIFRSSVNFMGCYAAIHALKLGKMICDTEAAAQVLIVCTELCTLHFQQEFNLNNAASSLLFADGSAAVLLSNSNKIKPAFSLDGFYSKLAFKGKNDMAWQLGSNGFLMTLSGYVPQLIEEDISTLVDEALKKNNKTRNDLTDWCIHPGGKKILDNIEKQLKLCPCALHHSRNVLRNYGNMSSATILFVLKKMLEDQNDQKNRTVFGVAFGPGLTMETFIASSI